MSDQPADKPSEREPECPMCGSVDPDCGCVAHGECSDCTHAPVPAPTPEPGEPCASDPAVRHPSGERCLTKPEPVSGEAHDDRNPQIGWLLTEIDELEQRAASEKERADEVERLMLRLIADNDATSLVLADIAKVIGVFNIRGNWYRPEEFAALVALHVHGLEAEVARLSAEREKLGEECYQRGQEITRLEGLVEHYKRRAALEPSEAAKGGKVNGFVDGDLTRYGAPCIPGCEQKGEHIHIPSSAKPEPE